jgi:hypothetical protein
MTVVSETWQRQSVSLPAGKGKKADLEIKLSDPWIWRNWPNITPESF